MSPTHRNLTARLWAGRGALLLPSALFLTCFELMKARRSSVWMGADLADWPGVLLGLGTYLALFGVLTQGVCWKSARLTGPRRHAVLLRQAAAVVLAWLLFALICGTVRGPTIALVAATLFGLWVGPLLLNRGGRDLTAPWSVLCTVALLAGASSLVVSDDLSILSPDRLTLVTVWPAVYALEVGLATAWVWLFCRNPSVYLKGAAIALPIAFPFLVLATHASSLPGKIGTKPNLVLITCDALRADCCSAYGGDVPTPAIEALADRGVLFERSYSLAPWTLPSMVGMFESAYPSGIAPHTPEDRWLLDLALCRIDDETPTLAELLAASGYATGGFTANALLQGRNGMLRGFGRTAVLSHRTPVRTGVLRQLPVLQSVTARLWPMSAPERPVDTTRILTRYARRFIRLHREEPFFLWLHFMDPHAAYNPPAEYRTLEGPHPVFCNSDPRWGWAGYPRDPETGDIVLPPAEERYVESLYRGEVRYVDQCIGRVVDALVRSRVEDRTFVCVTSDHGEEFWEHGRYGHGQSLFDELVRVPLVVAGPGLAARRVEHRVSGIDLMPTVSDLVGLPPEPRWTGHSLVELVTGMGTLPDTPCFAHSTNPLVTAEPLQAVISEEWKLVLGLESGQMLLFNTEQDPLEAADLSETHPEQVRLLRSRLTEWSASFPSTFEERRIEESPPADGELMEQLRHIGYL